MKRHSQVKYSYPTKEYPKPKKAIKIKQKRINPIYFFMITLFIVGFFSGSAVSYDLHNKGLLSVINSVIDTINLLSADHSIGLLLKSFFTHFIYIFIIWFLSLTIIGIILVIFIVFFYGFMYGVVMSSFSYQMGLQGFIIGFFYTFPQNIIIIPLVIYISTQSIRISIAIFKNLFQNNGRKYLKNLLNQYYNQLLFSSGVLIIYAFIMVIFGHFFINILKSLI